MVLKQVHDTNMRAKGHPERVFSVSAALPTVLPTTPS